MMFNIIQHWCPSLNISWTEFPWNIVENISNRWTHQSTLRGSVILTLLFISIVHPVTPPHPQLSVIEASPARDGSCGVHHRGARLQRPFPWASGRPRRTAGLGRSRESTHPFICIPELFVSDRHFCPYSFNCIHSLNLKSQSSFQPKIYYNPKLET